MTPKGRERACASLARAIASLALAFAPCLHAADPWDLSERYVGGSVADADWTIDESFPGTKLILEGRYYFLSGPGKPRERSCECEPAPTPLRMLGTLAGQLQWGKGETGLEYGTVWLTALASQRVFETPGEGLRPMRDTLEWGALRVAKDDPLGIDSYVELNIARVSRTWRYPLRDSPWTFTVGLNVSGGYAWADSTDPTYRGVSSPILGTWFKGTVARAGWGQIYLEQRVVNGWTFSSPAAGGAVTREARARFGYIAKSRRCLQLEVYAEKRSFNFTDSQIDDLYTASKRIGVELDCMF
jgi:hypothetical protein